uniref:NADH-ubiquinone oxidoreductase chain 5 n=1 Tax=Rhyacophila kando TaxID=2904902 RepID=A0A9E8LPB5_9NEOP|nr:NADH dehydrogenase subunit 5 [Rhyacophila kando]UZZ44358.1 NADH dehydrogenase subunit 5 [Rhyacophila kando]
MINNNKMLFFFVFLLFFMSLLFMSLGIFLYYKNLVIMLEWELVSLNSVIFMMTILLDWMSMFFMMIVLMISSMVILYSSEYMGDEVNMDRFIILILLFVFSMMLMIISPNLISILLGWDGLGLISYCLVIYYQNVKSYNSGMLTVLMNRVGDVMILMGIVWMVNFGSWNYIYLYDFIENDYLINIISIFVVLAAMTKSAQIPFSSWLPAAMAAPTPISALVHSSTLVTAGVYLLIRFSMFLDNLWILKFLLLISSLTMLMSGMSALLEFDLKKIIALSTLSQLGLMMMILSMGMSNLAYFHLLSHAFFKALLFMCGGMIIHIMGHNQDIRYMGNMMKMSPLIALNLNVSNLALCGFPFMAGFYSKDLILEMFLMVNYNMLIMIILFISTGFTVSYTVRLLYYSMFYDYNMFSYFSIKESNIMVISTVILMICSIIGGSMLSWLILFTPKLIYLTFHMKMLVLYVISLGVILMYLNLILLMKFRYYLLKMNKVSVFLNYMWFFSSLSLFGLNYWFLMTGFKSLKILDFGWGEYYLSQGIFKNLIKLSMINQLVQYNFLKIYLMIFFIYLLLIIFSFFII